MGGLEPLGGILLQAAPDHPHQARGHAVRLDLGWIAAQDRGERVRRGIPAERPPAGQHLVEDRPQGEEVRARVRPLTTACSGDMYPTVPITRPASVMALRVSARGSSSDRRRAPQLREAEVQDLDLAARGQEEVLGLEVAVDDAALMRRRQPPADLHP